MNAPAERSRPRLSRRRKLLFAAVPLVLLLAVGELAARWLREGRDHAPVTSGSYRDRRIDLIRRGYPAAHDATLGYVPRPGFASADNRWGTLVSIDERGLRRNGAGPRPPGERGVLAVGDSFTFGDQVADDQSWPARLEVRLQQPVWNGGVFGYSFAQTVLRAERLLDTLPADGATVATLVVSLIPEDIQRCELSKRFTEVPWYDLQGGELVLKNVPVPDSENAPQDRQWVRKALGYSALCDLVLWNVAPGFWVGDQREVRAHPRGTGGTIARKLLDRLAARCRAGGVRLLLVLQDVAQPTALGIADGQALLQHAAATNVQTLDLQTAFTALARNDASVRTTHYAGHMTAVGNAWVAERVAEALTR